MDDGLPSVEITKRFLVLCEQYGSHKMVGLADYRRAHGALSGRGIEWELILVDDDSNDGSEQMVAELARRLPVRLATRRGAPRDLSLSVLLGVRLARFDRCLGYGRRPVASAGVHRRTPLGPRRRLRHGGRQPLRVGRRRRQQLEPAPPADFSPGDLAGSSAR